MTHDPTKLADMHRIFEAAFNDGDLDALVDLFEPRAVLVPSPEQSAHGRDQIRVALQAYLAARPTIRIQTTAVVETAEGVGLTSGKWNLKGTGPDGQPLEMAGVGAEVFRRQEDGRWLFVIDNPFAE
jgi:uncharacterized protein (TIGR02246 family)